jgi:toxin YxiD
MGCVQDFHSYFVSDFGVLVHNACDPILPNELDVGTYKDLRQAGTPGDNITPHHIPSAEHMKKQGVKHTDGITINMEHKYPSNKGRHPDTFTFGSKNKNGGGDVNGT